MCACLLVFRVRVSFDLYDRNMTVAVPCCVQSTREQQTANWVAASNCFCPDASENGSGDSEQSPAMDSSGSPPEDANDYHYLEQIRKLQNTNTVVVEEIRKLQDTNTEVVEELFKQRAAAEQAQRVAAAEQAQREQAQRVVAEQAQRLVELERKYQRLEHESAALRQTAQVLQTSYPEAALLWQAQNDALNARDAALNRNQAVSEQRRKKVRSLSHKLERRAAMERRPVSNDFVKIARQRLVGASEDGFRDFISHEIIANVKSPDTGKKKRQWRNSKIASDSVWLNIPGSSTSREGPDGWIGGLVSNPLRLASMITMWCSKNVSIRAVANMAAQEFTLAQEALYVSAVRHKGGETTKRKAFPGSNEKPMEVLGSYCESTVADGIHAFLNALDRYVSEHIKTADGIHMSLDISTFAFSHMQSLFLAAWRVLNKGFDAAENPLPYVERIEGFAPAVAVGEKLTRQFVDEDGNLYSTATVRAAATSIILADLLDILKHPCLSFGVDGGGEGEGGGTIQAQKEAAGQTKTV